MKPPILEIPSLSPYEKPYRITFEKLEASPEYRALSKGSLREFEELYLKIQEKPKKHIQTLKQLFHKCPGVPEIANLLTYALLKSKKRKAAEQLIKLTFEIHPAHLTARINYADQLIRLGKKEKVPEVIPLRKLLQERESFHYAEFRGLMVVMGFYYLESGEKEKAEECYELAFQVDPLHPSVTALEKKISKRFLLRRGFKALLTFLKIRRLTLCLF